MLEELLDPQIGTISGRFAANSLKNIISRYRVAKGVKGQYKALRKKDYELDPCNADYNVILEELQSKFPDDPVDLGLMDDRPFIEEKVIASVNNGVSRVIVVHTMIGVSSHTEEIVDRVEGLGLRRKGVEFVFTEPLWNDEAFIKHKVHRVLDLIGGTDKSKVGVAILEYGLPAIPTPGRLAWASVESNARYAQAYMKKLEQNGITNLMAGYLRWLKPDLAECARALAEKGATHIVFDWFHVARNLHSILDIPNHFEKLQLELPDIKLVMVGPEKDSPGFIDVLANQIERAKKKFKS